MTLWELCLHNAGPRGHLLTIGTPEQIVDVMEHWFRNGAADGFNVMPAWLPGSLEDFVDMVIPGIATPRPVPHRVRRPDLAGEPRPAEAARAAGSRWRLVAQ